MRIVTVSEEKSLGAGRDEPSEPVLLVSRQREPRVLREDHVYSWLEDYLVRLDGKEARDECYAWLE